MNALKTDLWYPRTLSTKTFIALYFAGTKRRGVSQAEGRMYVCVCERFYIFHSHRLAVWCLLLTVQCTHTVVHVHAFNILSIISWVLFLFLFASRVCFYQFCRRLFNRECIVCFDGGGQRVAMVTMIQIHSICVYKYMSLVWGSSFCCSPHFSASCWTFTVSLRRYMQQPQKKI